jgi:hypothetical protein
MASSLFVSEKTFGTETATGTWCGEAGGLSVSQLSAAVASPLARCSGSSRPDDWFPEAVLPDRARAEAARALRLCAACPVRAQCLELSMRLWQRGGRDGIWGGLISADRVQARRKWLAGVPVAALLAGSG